MPITQAEKHKFLSAIKLYKKYRLNKIKKYRKRNIRELKAIIHNCNSSLEDLENEVSIYCKTQVKSGIIIFGYCLFSFGHSMFKRFLIEVMTVEKIKKQNKYLTEVLESQKVKTNQLEEEVKMLKNECAALHDEEGELQITISTLIKEKNQLFLRVLKLVEEINQLKNTGLKKNDEVITKKLF